MSDQPLVIDVVDNGGQWTHREWRMLRYLKVDTQIIDNTTPVDEHEHADEGPGVVTPFRGRMKGQR